MSKWQRTRGAFSYLMRAPIVAPTAAASALTAEVYRRNLQKTEKQKARQAVDDFIADFKGREALQSVEEFIRYHEEYSNASQDLKTYLTKDPKTLAIA